MNVKVEKSDIKGEVAAVSSKSQLIRALLASFLCFGESTELKYTALCEDAAFCVNCLETLGASFDGKVLSSPELIRDNVTLNVGESGTLFRMLLPVLCAIGGNYEFVLEKSLSLRPEDELFSALKSGGIEIAKKGNLVTAKGKLSAKRYEISGNVSSQYLSGLLYALPLVKGESEIILTSEIKSRPYVTLTENMLKLFGVNVKKTPSGYAISGGQKYRSPKSVAIEGDYSSASYYLLAGALAGEVTVENLPRNSVQGDRAFVDILKSVGANVTITENSVTAKKTKISPFVVDIESCPDLAPSLAVLAAFSKGKSVLKNVSRLRFKESDRVESITSLLTALDIKSALSGDDLEIFGGTPKGGEIESFSDHRIAMAGTVALLLLGGEVKNAECVKKSDPIFFENIRKIKGKII